MTYGPLSVPAEWMDDPVSYREAVILAGEHVLALPERGEAVYVPKARDELPLLLDAWPHLLVVPTTRALSIDDMIRLRAWPVHPLGVAEGPTWADGRWCSPAELFFHDVDHARFKVREDLLARDIEIADPYVDGSTFDAGSQRHRTVVDLAIPHLDDDGWTGGPVRATRADRWLAAIEAEPEHELAEAARWLLFETVHEKALPLESAVLAAALSTPAHVDKLRSKAARGFFADHGPSSEAIAALDDARVWLSALVEGSAA